MKHSFVWKMILWFRSNKQNLLRDSKSMTILWLWNKFKRRSKSSKKAPRNQRKNTRKTKSIRANQNDEKEAGALKEVTRLSLVTAIEIEGAIVRDIIKKEALGGDRDHDQVPAVMPVGAKTRNSRKIIVIENRDEIKFQKSKLIKIRNPPMTEIDLVQICRYMPLGSMK